MGTKVSFSWWLSLQRDLWGAAILNQDPSQARVFQGWPAEIPATCFKGLQNSFCTTNILICYCVSRCCVKCFTRTWCKTLSIIHAFLPGCHLFFVISCSCWLFSLYLAKRITGWLLILTQIQEKSFWKEEFWSNSNKCFLFINLGLLYYFSTLIKLS